MTSLLCHGKVLDETDKENVGCVAKKQISKGKVPATSNGRSPLVSKNSNLPTTKDDASPKSLVSNINADIAWMDSYTVVLKRGRHGFGFSVLGSSPVRVSSVKPDTPAYTAGLQRGDCIVKINGQNVSRSMADSVAQIIRYSEKQIVMDIHRTDTSDAMSMSSEVSQYPCGEDSLAPLPPKFRSSPSFVPRPLSVMSSSSHKSSIRELSASTISLHCALPKVDRTLQSLGCEESDFDMAVEKLIKLETDFVHAMEQGMNSYLLPLNSCDISPSEHATLFQNIEQLYRFSAHHLSKLLDCQSSQMTLQVDMAPGSVYQPWAEAMSDAYETYCNGIKNAFRLLLELSENAEFKTALRGLTKSAGGLSLSQFLQKPLQHIKVLVLTFQEIAVNTSIEHHEYKHVKFIIETLRAACNRINNNNTRRSPSVLSLASDSSKSSVGSGSPQPNQNCSPQQSESESLESSMMHSERSRTSNQTKSSSDQSMISIASVDFDVMDIQTRLVLPDHMPPLQIATATRHMIYAGDLFYFDGLLWKKLYVVLLSDLLLLTQADYEGLLTLWEEPIILCNIEQVVPQGEQVCEFSIVVKPGSRQGSSLQFQAPTIDLKATWTHLLDQRVMTFKAQMATAAAMDNIV